MKSKVLLSRLCIGALTASLLAGCSSAGSTSETANSSETESISSGAASETASESESTTTAAASFASLEKTDLFAQQDSIDEALQQEASAGYSFEEPNVIINPYGNSPLTAVAAFHTDKELGGTITVKGKDAKDDITGTFESAMDHLVPIYGLYNGDTTEIVLTLEDGTSTTLEVTTEKTEINVGTIEATMTDDSAYDYSNLTFVCSSAGMLYALDSAGDIRWYFADGGVLGVHQLQNGHLMMPTSFLLKSMYYKAGLQEIDLSGKIYHQYMIPGGMHHDFQELPDGNLLVASDSPDLSTVEDYVVEIDRESGEVVWELNAADLIGKEDGQSASIATDGSDEIDWFHNNSLWYDEKNDLVLLSARHKDAIIAVNKSDKSLAWILGDPADWDGVDKKYFFTPTGDDFEWQYAQHQITMLDNGDIMMFDNGTAKVKLSDNDNRVSGDDIYSRAVVYHINTDDMTIEQVFEYGKERGPQWYSDWISGVISLDGTKDQLWITAGANLYDEKNNRYDHYPTDMMQQGLIKRTHIDQVSNGSLAYEIVISGDTYASLTYRSLRLPLYTEGATLDVNAKGELHGTLGETATADYTVAFEDAAALPEGWEFTLDDAKFSLKGAYTTDKASDALEDAYVILVSGNEMKAYSLTQYGTDGDDATKVTVSGWVSPVGLEGKTWDIYLSVDGQVYESGHSIAL